MGSEIVRPGRTAPQNHTKCTILGEDEADDATKVQDRIDYENRTARGKELQAGKGEAQEGTVKRITRRCARTGRESR